jgi:hypothetical protein
MFMKGGKKIRTDKKLLDFRICGDHRGYEDTGYKHVNF